MNFDLPEATDGTTPKEKQRQVFFLGVGFYGAIFMVNVVFLLGYQLSTPHIAIARIIAPAFTVVFAVTDTMVLRNVCRKQFTTNPELLKKWPINVPLYPTSLYYVCLVLSVAVSGYLLSRL
jgi:hypothetical protein